MQYRRSLRFRILASFVVSGAILGPLVAMLLLFLTYELEERAVEEALQQRLEQLIESPERFAPTRHSAEPDLHVVASVRADRLPPEMFRGADGIREYRQGGEEWLVALATTDHGRYAVVQDISILEDRETIGFIIVGAGALLAMYAALWLGHYLSRRLLAPLIQLSQNVTETGNGTEQRAFADEFADDEVGLLASALDRYRRRTDEALRREREFSANASHELRNPLAIIQNAAEIIDEDREVPERSHRAARRIRGAAQQMSETINALLLMVRESPALDEQETVAIADCVERILEQVDPEGVEWAWECEAHGVVKAPPIAVETIVANLTRNAAQHSRASRIRLVLTGDRFVVADDGVGIPPADLQRITDRGHRGANAVGPGTGIGLSLVHRLCERFGWQLDIDSAPGRGTTATWRFG